MNTIGPYPATDVERKVLLDDLKMAMSINRAIREARSRDAAKPLTFDDLRVGDVIVMRHRSTGEESHWRVEDK